MEPAPYVTGRISIPFVTTEFPFDISTHLLTSQDALEVSVDEIETADDVLDQPDKSEDIFANYDQPEFDVVTGSPSDQFENDTILAQTKVDGFVINNLASANIEAENQAPEHDISQLDEYTSEVVTEAVSSDEIIEQIEDALEDMNKEIDVASEEEAAAGEGDLDPLTNEVDSDVIVDVIR